MNEADFTPMAGLRAIGCSPLLAQAVATCRDQLPVPTEPMRVFSVHRDTLALHDGQDELAARLTPRLARELKSSDSEIWQSATGFLRVATPRLACGCTLASSRCRTWRGAMATGVATPWSATSTAHCC